MEVYKGQPILTGKTQEFSEAVEGCLFYTMVKMYMGTDSEPFLQNVVPEHVLQSTLQPQPHPFRREDCQQRPCTVARWVVLTRHMLKPDTEGKYVQLLDQER